MNDEDVICYLSRNLTKTEIKYAHGEKLASAVIQVVQRFHHYILLCKTTVISDCNPMMYILTKQLLGGKYSKWIVILQEFDLEFEKFKAKKSLVFVEVMCDFWHTDTEIVAEEPIAAESLFLLSTLHPWYGDIIIYPNLFGLKSHDLSEGKYISNPSNTILLEIQSIIVGQILFSDVV